MKRAVKSTFVVIFALLAANQIVAQSVGIDLFNEMGDRNFVSYEGVSSLSWLPGDRGYFEAERTESGVEFYKVDPKSQKRTPLFDDRIELAIISQFNEATMSEVSALPFGNFEFVMNDKAIFFEVDDTDFVFHLNERKLRKLFKPEIERFRYDDELMLLLMMMMN